MASTITAGTTSGTALAMSGDTSGNMSLVCGSTVVAALTATGIAVTGTLSASGVTTNAAGSAALPSITTTGDTDTGVWFPAANTLAASTGGSERVRIDSSGNLLVGTTSAVSSAKQTIAFFTGWNGLAISTTDNIASTDFSIFRANGATCGAISRVGTTSAVVYTATSDYRLKENVQPFINALATVAKLNPVTYVWKDCGIVANGFIAHELQEVCPDAVVGTKDEIDADGNPKYQAIDQSKMVALLTAAIQEQQALIIQLQADVAALKGVKV